MTREEYLQQYIQKPQHTLKIGDIIKLKNRPFSFEPIENATYKIIEFLEKDYIRIKGVFTGKERVITGDKIVEVMNNE